jgi:hypothetical protein
MRMGAIRILSGMLMMRRWSESMIRCQIIMGNSTGKLTDRGYIRCRIHQKINLRKVAEITF